jgi:K+ transporter
MELQPSKSWTIEELTKVLNSQKYKGIIINASVKRAYNTVTPRGVKICLAKRGTFMVREPILSTYKKKK